jgi:regulator of sirC expression with transglutaminase-like and TPR domain
MIQQQEPVYCRPAAYRLFQQQVAIINSIDSSIDNSKGGENLFRAAFAIALHERPEAELSEVETIVENLADSVMRRVHSRSATALIAHLHDVLFDVFGLRGNVDDYFNPANSYLPDVLRSQQGLPITLVLIYKRVAAPLGLTVHGVNAPGHFLAEVEADDPAGRPLYIDPFFGGALLSEVEVVERVSQATGLDVGWTPELLRRATHRQWLGRMLNNLQAAFAAAGQQRDVCAMQELQALL